MTPIRSTRYTLGRKRNAKTRKDSKRAFRRAVRRTSKETAS